jgi:2-oxoglutarate ferredoxin oxidoreductase subunit beta
MIEPRIARSVNMESKPSNFCPGCGYGIILKALGEVIDEMEVGPRTVFGIDIGCNLLAWDYYKLDTIQTHHGRVTPLISGYKRGQKESVVIGIAGDGGLYSIGLQSLLHTAHRNEAVTVIGVNNTLYAMTGGQAGPTTMKNEVTDSSPNGKFTYDKPFFGPELVKNVAEKGAFLARGSVDNIANLKQLLKQAIENQLKGNFSMVEVLSYCPTNWKTNARETIDRLDVMKKVYPLGVIDDGKNS